jgi:hypothetical protein
MATYVAPTSRLAALAVARAWLAGDRDAGVLVLMQNGVTTDNPKTLDFVMATASVVSQTLLSTCGYNVERALAQLDQWMREEQVKANEAA